MTRKQLISACVDWQIEKGFVKKENREKQIKIRLNGMGYQKPMLKADCQRWYDALFKENQPQPTVIDEQDEQEEMLEIKRNSIKNYLKEHIDNYYMWAKMDYNVDGGFIEANFVNNNNFTETIFIKWYENGYIYTGSILWDEQYPPKAIYNIWMDGYYTEIEVKEIAEKNTQNESRKEEQEMTKKEKIIACVDFEIEKGKIKKSDRNFEINSRLNGCKWRPAMNNAELNSWYNDCFNPEYQQSKQELENKINSWFLTNNVKGSYKEAEFYDNGNGLSLHIVWQQKENETQVSYSCHFAVKDFTVEAIFASWLEYIPQPSKIENETETETQPSEVGKYFLFPHKLGEYRKFYIAKKNKKSLILKNRENGKTLSRQIYLDKLKGPYITLLGIKMLLSELKSDSYTCSSHENQQQLERGALCL